MCCFYFTYDNNNNSIVIMLNKIILHNRTDKAFTIMKFGKSTYNRCQNLYQTYVTLMICLSWVQHPFNVGAYV